MMERKKQDKELMKTALSQRAKPTASSIGVEAVAEKLRREIFSGARVPKERLIENKLAENYSVNRMIVRQALGLLEKEDLVVIEPYKGASVADISLSAIDQNYQVLAMLEGFATKLAMKYLSHRDLEDLREIVKTQKKIEAKDVKEWQVLNIRFHRLINLKCNNEKLIRILEQNVQFTSYWFLMLSTFGRITESNKEHEMIVNALSRRDAQRASQLMERHILDSGGYLIKSISENLPIAAFGIES